MVKKIGAIKQREQLLKNVNMGEQLYDLLMNIDASDALKELALTDKNILSKMHKAFQRHLLGNSEAESGIIALAMLALHHLEQGECPAEHLPLKLYLAAECAKYVDVYAAHLMIQSKDEEAYLVCGHDNNFIARAALWIEEINGSLRRSEGGKKGGGKNRALDPQTVRNAYNNLTVPERNRVSILAERFGVTPRTIRNTLMRA